MYLSFSFSFHFVRCFVLMCINYVDHSKFIQIQRLKIGKMLLSSNKWTIYLVFLSIRFSHEEHKTLHTTFAF